MALASKDSIGGNGAPFFTPADHTNDLALIFEPKSIRRDVKATKGIRDEMLAQVTVFRSQKQLDDGKPHEVKLYTVTAKKIVSDLDKILAEAKRAGDPAPAIIKTVGIWRPPTDPTIKVWVLKDAQDADYELAVAYYEKREAATQAALESVPDF